MSIYATLWEIKAPRRHRYDDEYVLVYAQAVPPHIGHPSHYPEGDPYAGFLPPVVRGYDPEQGKARIEPWSLCSKIGVRKTSSGM